MKHSMIAASACALIGCGAELAPPPQVALDSLADKERQRLTPADTNRDGAIDAVEIAQFYVSRLHTAYAQFDANGDGKLELAELPVALRARLAPADTNHDGVLSERELRVLHNKRIVQRLTRADVDGDGAVDEAELGPVRWARLQAADLDHDGKLTFAELQQAYVRRAK